MLATLSSQEAHRYLIAFLIVVVAIAVVLITFVVASVRAYRATRRDPRLQRTRPERARPCDLGAAYRSYWTSRRQREHGEIGRVA